MLFLDYDDLEQRLVPLWDAFIEYMDGPNMPKMAPPGVVLEKFQNFKGIAGAEACIIPLLQQYLSADNSADLENRCAIFLHSLQHGHEAGVFAQWENDPKVFSHEQSHAFRNKTALQQRFTRQRNELAQMKHHGDVDMNVFFAQHELDKVQNELHAYTTEKYNNTYTVVDPLTYLTRVAALVLSYSAEQCLKHPNGVVQVQPVQETVEPLRVSVQRKRVEIQEKTNAVLLAHYHKTQKLNIGKK